MADRLEWFDVTIPAGTTQANPASFPMVFFQGEVVEIDVRILSGPEGSVGFFITAGGSQYVPRTRGSFVIPDDDYFQWPVSHAITSGSWGLTGYNTDLYPHLIQVAFHVNEVPSLQPAGASPVGVSSTLLASAMSLISPQQATFESPLSPDALIASVPPGAFDAVDTITSPVASAIGAV